MTRNELQQLLNREVYYDVPRSRFSRFLFRILRLSLAPSREACYLIRKMQYYNGKPGKIASYKKQRLHAKLLSKYSMFISPNAVIGEGLHLPHPLSIVIGDAARIGKNVSIYQNVTIGGARIGDVKKGNQPRIEDGVTIFAQSAVLGHVHIGRKCTIGAHSLCLSDTEDGSVYVGIPARRVK